MRASIVIPNWNGKHLLRKNLPVVLATGADEVIVVDNGSTDGSVEMVKKMINGQWLMIDKKDQSSVISHQSLAIRLIENKTNLGFATACNQGVEKAKNEVVILLNNDVVPKKDFLKGLMPHFEDKKTFAVSCHEPQFSWAKGEWVDGFIEHKPGTKTKKAHISFWASGGSAAFSRPKWQKLGGFDTLYDPFYWEDIDLSCRAWKRGWKVLWEPQSIVHHKHEATVGRFSKAYIDYISQRNQLLFIWKNITSSPMFSEHRRVLVKRLGRNPGYVKPFLGALAKLFEVLPKREKEKKEAKVADEEIFKLFK